MASRCWALELHPSLPPPAPGLPAVQALLNLQLLHSELLRHHRAASPVSSHGIPFSYKDATLQISTHPQGFLLAPSHL